MPININNQKWCNSFNASDYIIENTLIKVTQTQNLNNAYT